MLDAQFLLETVFYGVAALSGGGLAANNVLKERQRRLDAKAAEQARFERQIREQAEEKKRQAEALARLEEQRWLDELERQRVARQQDKERVDLGKAIEQAYEWVWMRPANSLLMGTQHHHVLTADRSPDVPPHLKSVYATGYRDIPVWFSGEQMGITVGTTGGKKFTAAVAPNVLTYDGNCFVIDPKGEVCAVTAHARKFAHQQNVYRLDPFDATRFTPGAYAPERSSYNPLDALDPDSPLFVSDTAALVEALCVTEAKGENRYWADNARELLQALILFVCSHPHPREKRNLHQVYEYLSADPIEVEWFLGEMKKSPFSLVRNCAKSYGTMPDKTREGVRTQARTEVQFFALPEIEQITSFSSFDLTELFAGDCTLYLVLPPQYLKSHNRWLRLMMAVCQMTAVRENSGKHVLWIVDEAAQLGELEAIPKAYTLLRSYGVRIWTFWQSLQQLEKTYPNDWETLIGNSFLQVMAANDNRTAKYFSELAGEYEALKKSVTEGRSEGGGTTQTHGDSSGDSWTNTNTTGDSTNSTPGKGLLGSWFPTVSTGSNRSEAVGSGTQKTTTFSVSNNTTYQVSQSTTLSLQWEPSIRANELTTMAENVMYLKLPGTLSCFVAKATYHSLDKIKGLAKINPYFRTPQGKKSLLALPKLPDD